MIFSLIKSFKTILVDKINAVKIWNELNQIIYKYLTNYINIRIIYKYWFININ